MKVTYNLKKSHGTEIQAVDDEKIVGISFE